MPSTVRTWQPGWHETRKVSLPLSPLCPPQASPPSWPFCDPDRKSHPRTGCSFLRPSTLLSGSLLPVPPQSQPQRLRADTWSRLCRVTAGHSRAAQSPQPSLPQPTRQPRLLRRHSLGALCLCLKTWRCCPSLRLCARTTTLSVRPPSTPTSASTSTPATCTRPWPSTSTVKTWPWSTSASSSCRGPTRRRSTRRGWCGCRTCAGAESVCGTSAVLPGMNGTAAWGPWTAPCTWRRTWTRTCCTCTCWPPWGETATCAISWRVTTCSNRWCSSKSWGTTWSRCARWALRNPAWQSTCWTSSPWTTARRTEPGLPSR